MKTFREDFIFSGEAVETCGAEITLNEEFLNKIKRAMKILSEDEGFASITIDAWQLDIKQFDSTMDDEDCKEIPYKDDSYFRSDTPYIIVYKVGSVYLRAFGKWDASQYYEMEIKL